MSGIVSQGPIFIACLVFLLGVVVIVHEYGHYVAGRFYGAAVESFSVGFGKPIFEKTDKRGTRWRLNWIPLGGFVKFVGESQMAGDVGKIEQGPKGKPFHEVGVWGRTVVAAAGPMANFLLATLIFAVILFANGASESRVAVAEVGEGGAAQEAGLQAGDVFVSIDGKEIRQLNQVPMIISLSSGETLETVVERSGEQKTFALTPKREWVENAVGQKQQLGFANIRIARVADTSRHVQYNPAEALWKGGEQTWDTLVLTTDLIGRMVTGKEALSNLSGPVAIGDVSRRLVNRTMGADHVPLWQRIEALTWSLLSVCAAVSVGIGFFNLLPFPVLDGGHIVFNCYEAIAGKPLPERIQEGALMAGMVLLLGMFVFITWGDVLETGLFNSTRG